MTAVAIRPSAARLDRELARARTATTRFDAPTDFDTVPIGFHRGSTREVVGQGRADYDAARRCVADWSFLPRWIRVHPRAAAQVPGEPLVVIADTLGVRWMLPTRVLESIADDDGKARGFVYVALAGHIAEGYERFVVGYDDATSAVTFDVTAVARPTHPVLRVVPPTFRVLQWWFRRCCMHRMRDVITAG